jgi:hypothetical protein
LSARQTEEELRGLQPLPAWQAESQLRGLQRLPTRQAEIQLRGVQSVIDGMEVCISSTTLRHRLRVLTS